MTLPPFPVDDQTLNLLEAAMNPREHGDPNAETASVWPLLTFMSQMAGAGDTAHYHDNDVHASLIAEVRRLRLEVATADLRGYGKAVARLRDEPAAQKWWLRESDAPFEPDLWTALAEYLEEERP